MKVYMMALMVALFAPFSFASSTRTIIQEEVELEFEKPYLIEIETDKALHVGFIAKEFDCKNNCLQMVRKNGDSTPITYSTQHGMNVQYSPFDGKIVVAFQYLNPGKKSVSIYTENRICDSEACALLRKHNITYPYKYDEVDFEWARIIIKDISEISSSSDGSFTRVKGETVFGSKFDAVLLNWLIDEPEYGGSCPEFIANRKDDFKNTGKGYSFSGTFISQSSTGKLTSIMTDVGCGKWDYGEQKEGFL